MSELLHFLKMDRDLNSHSLQAQVRFLPADLAGVYPPSMIVVATGHSGGHSAGRV